VNSTLYLDIDGVLNTHECFRNGYCGIHRDKIELVNWIVDNAKCNVVIISAWRYLVLAGSMTLKGFSNLLFTHGADDWAELIRVLPFDIGNGSDRGQLVANDIANNHVTNYIILDDLDLAYTSRGLNCVIVDGRIGLTPSLAQTVLSCLTI